jgi:trigger factor
MKIEVKDLAKSRKELNVNVDEKFLNETYDKKLKDIRKTAKIPGFRQGMAPEHLIKKYYHNKIMAESLESVINKATMDALKEKSINPLNMPIIKDVKLEEDHSVSFNIQVDVYPQFDVIKYKDFIFTQEIKETNDVSIEEELKALQLRHATFEPKNEDAIADSNDLLTVDILEDIDGMTPEESKDFSFIIDNNDFHKEFNDAVKGMKKGETKAFTIKYPSDHPDKRFAGKEVKYTVYVKEIKERVLPEINDDFAKEVGEKFENLEDLKKNIRENLEKNEQIRSRNELTEKILKKIVEENPFEIPESMIIQQAESMAKQLLENYKQLYGEEVVKHVPIDKIIDDMKPRAEFQIKAALVINKIAEKENLSVSEDELEVKVKEYAERLKKPYEELKQLWQKNGMLQTIKDNILIDKVHAYLVSVNKIEEKIISQEHREDKPSEEE